MQQCQALHFVIFKCICTRWESILSMYVHTYMVVMLRNFSEQCRFPACGFLPCGFQACGFPAGHLGLFTTSPVQVFQPWRLMDRRALHSCLAELEQLHVEPEQWVLNIFQLKGRNLNKVVYRIGYWYWQIFVIHYQLSEHRQIQYRCITTCIPLWTFALGISELVEIVCSTVQPASLCGLDCWRYISLKTRLKTCWW